MKSSQATKIMTPYNENCLLKMEERGFRESALAHVCRNSTANENAIATAGASTTPEAALRQRVHTQWLWGGSARTHEGRTIWFFRFDLWFKTMKTCWIFSGGKKCGLKMWAAEQNNNKRQSPIDTNWATNSVICKAIWKLFSKSSLLLLMRSN